MAIAAALTPSCSPAEPANQGVTPGSGGTEPCGPDCVTTTNAGADSVSATMAAVSGGSTLSSGTSSLTTGAMAGSVSMGSAAGGGSTTMAGVSNEASSSATTDGSGGTTAAAVAGTGSGGSGGNGTSSGGTSSGGTSSGGTSGGGAGGNGDTLLVPATGALLGLFTPAQTQAELMATETQVGRQWAIHLGYFDWALDFTSFAQANIGAGRIPYVTVEPWSVTLESIASGAQDSVIQNQAAGVRDLPGKIMLRFAHEMNGDWYPWDGYNNGADSSAPAKYVSAYRHVHDVFEAAGATNVLWVFCPNVDSVPNESWNQWDNYYPGDEYVDWMCYDGYNWGTDTFASMTARIYPGLAAKNKPILLGETSTQDLEKATWIQEILPSMQAQFPMLKALVWFQVNKENDWRYDSTPSSLSAFVDMANHPYFNP